jgi:phosphatidate cytidylyltransferase
MAILIGLAVGAVVLASLLFIKWLFLVFAMPVCLLGVFEFEFAGRCRPRAGASMSCRRSSPARSSCSPLLRGHLTHWV